MLITLCSSKGAPGVTSAGLALAAVWPRPVVLVEADPTGGDVALRCRAAGGGDLTPRPGLLDLAGDIRTGAPDAVLAKATQLLACGVGVVQGVTVPTQAMGLSALWPMIAQAARAADVDVIADVGRLTGAPRALITAATQVLVVCNPRLEQMVHVRETVKDLVAQRETAGLVQPVMAGPARHAAADCSDLDRILAAAAVPATRTFSIAWDSDALHRLEAGMPASGKLAKSPLITSARRLSEHVLATIAASEKWARA